MGLGRREFLKLTSIISTGFLINPFKAVITNNDTYLNKKLGIAFNKPPGWYFLNMKDFGDLEDKQVFQLDVENINEVEWDDNDPICVITKYDNESKSNDGRFSPAIVVDATPKSIYEELGVENFEEFVKSSEYNTSKILKKYKVIKRYAPYEIYGVKTYEVDIRYIFEHQDLKRGFTAEYKSIKFEHNHLYYEINMHFSSFQNEYAEPEYRNFIKSIKLL